MLIRHSTLHVTLLLLLTTLLTGCGTDRRVAEGRFQKRQHRSGWHVDLHRSTDGPVRPRTIAPERPVARRSPAPSSTTPERPLTASPAIHIGPGSQGDTTPSSHRAHRTPLPAGVAEVARRDRDIAHPPVVFTDEPRRGGIEGTALVAFLLAIAFWFLLMLGAEAILLAVLLLSLIMAFVALARIRKHRTQGTGFAMFALLNGLLMGILFLLWLNHEQ